MIKAAFSDLPPLPNSELEGSISGLLLPLKGSLRLHEFRYGNDFVTELARVCVPIPHIIDLHATVWTGVQKLIIACAPTPRVLNIMRQTCELFLPLRLSAGGLRRFSP